MIFNWNDKFCARPKHQIRKIHFSRANKFAPQRMIGTNDELTKMKIYNIQMDFILCVCMYMGGNIKYVYVTFSCDLFWLRSRTLECRNEFVRNEKKKKKRYRMSHMIYVSMKFITIKIIIYRICLTLSTTICQSMDNTRNVDVRKYIYYINIYVLYFHAYTEQWALNNSRNLLYYIRAYVLVCGALLWTNYEHIETKHFWRSKTWKYKQKNILSKISIAFIFIFIEPFAAWLLRSIKKPNAKFRINLMINAFELIMNWCI